MNLIRNISIIFLGWAIAFNFTLVQAQSGNKVVGFTDANKDGINTIFVQRGFPLSAAKRLATTINGKVEFIDPLATDYCSNLVTIANLIATSMK